MKKKISLLFAFITTLVSYAQISFSINDIDLSDNYIEYDSLKNISIKNIRNLKGQTLYLIPDESCKQAGEYYFNFYASIFGQKRIIYKPKAFLNITNYSDVCGKYFYIVGYQDAYNDLHRTISYMELLEKESGSRVYLEISEFATILEKNFAVVGYIEKLKKRFVGHTFIIRTDNQDFGETKGIRIWGTNTTDNRIKKGTVFTCSDISFLNSGDNKIIYVLENEHYGKYYIEVNNAYLLLEDKIKIEENNQKWNDHITNLKKEKEEKQKTMIAKYGKVNGQLIYNGIVKIGFSKQMCIESWGKPIKINTSTGSYGTHEQWVYENEKYLYFENGKLSSFQTSEEIR